jgi:hypothetical protein
MAADPMLNLPQYHTILAAPGQQILEFDFRDTSGHFNKEIWPLNKDKSALNLRSHDNHFKRSW